MSPVPPTHVPNDTKVAVIVRISTQRLVRTALVLASATAVAVAAAACGGTGSSSGGDKTVTVYSADGLGDWYKTQFAKFKDQTGISVNEVEAGSGEVVNRVDKEQSNPQADIVVTLPPFIQKAAKSGLLQDSGVDTGVVADADKDPGGKYVTLAGNYLCFIANPRVANSDKLTWDDLLKPDYKGKVQYSTPGQAGDGTAVLVLLQQLYGKQGALDYLAKLQPNNVGPSSSTGKLQPKVDNGELLIANGDVQMNLQQIKDKGAKFNVFFPATADGKHSTVAVPYVMGMAKGAPHKDAAKKLMEYLLSADVQKTLGPDAVAVPVRKDLKDAPAPAGTISPAGYVKDVTVINPDWTKVLTDLDGDVAAYQKATGS